jgi:hypothetical protein
MEMIPGIQSVDEGTSCAWDMKILMSVMKNVQYLTISKTVYWGATGGHVYTRFSSDSHAHREDEFFSPLLWPYSSFYESIQTLIPGHGPWTNELETSVASYGGAYSESVQHLDTN